MEIIRLEDSKMDLAVDCMVSAFMNDDLYVYFEPDYERRRQFLTKFMGFRLRFGMKRGMVHVTDDFKGLAIWMQPHHEMGILDLLMCGGVAAIMGLSSDARKRIMSFSKHESSIRKGLIKQPYWYLSPLCVANDFQGRGYGRLLLEKGLKEVDKTQQVCFLETQSDKNTEIYKKFGFEILNQSVLDGTSIPHFCMSRTMNQGSKT